MRIRSERLTWREIDGEIVALDLKSSMYFTANSTASVLIKRLAEASATKAELVEALSSEFEVAPDAVESDVDEFIRELDARGLLDMEGG